MSKTLTPVALTGLFVFFGCSSQADSARSDASETAQHARSELEETAKATHNDMAESAENAEKQGRDVADAGMARVAEESDEVVAALGEAMNTELSIDGLKQKVGSWAPAELSGIADGLVSHFQANSSLIEGVKSQIDTAKNLGGQVADLDSQLGRLTSTNTDLASRLRVVTTALADHGVDVTKYTSLLN